VDLRGASPVSRFTNKFERVSSSADGRLIATYGSYPHRVQFWNAETGAMLTQKLLQDVEGSVPAHHIEFAPDNETVVVLRGQMLELCNARADREPILLVDRAYTNAVMLRAAR
jgi:hypothetical protein